MTYSKNLQQIPRKFWRTIRRSRSRTSATPSQNTSASTRPRDEGPQALPTAHNETQADRVASPSAPTPVAACPDVAHEADTGIDLWAKAFSLLSEKQTASLTALINNGDPEVATSTDTPASSITQDVITATKLRQKECENRFWRFPLGRGPENEVALREHTANIVAWVTKAGDIAMEFAPSLAKQVWPGVKALLEIPVKEAEQMEAVLKVADQVARVAARGRVYEECFTEVEVGAEVGAEALKSFRATLVELYKACLELLATATGLLDQNAVKRTMHSILHPDAVKNAAGTAFAELEKRLDSDVGAVSAIANKASFKRLEAPVERILQSINDREDLEILNWISDVQYASQHNAITEKRMADTCDWLLHHTIFREWEKSEKSALMWLYGLTGTGKTFLTSKVIDDNKIFLTKNHNQGLAFFYFNRNDSSRDSALSCLRSLVRQLLTPHGHQGHIPPDMRDLYNNYRRETRSFTWDELRKKLAELVGLFERTTVLIDALDECILEQDRKKLIEMLSGLMAGTKRRLLVFVSGRPEVDIQKALGDRVVVKIGVQDNEHDIAKFVLEKMTAHSRWDKFSEATQLKAVKTLREKSRGMFRLTALQVEELLGKRMEEDIIAHLGRLPKDLTAAYDGIYSRQIAEPGGVESAVAERALLWVLAAREPVSSPLLLPAVRINVGCYNDQFRNAGNTNSNLPSIRNTPDCGKDITSEVDEDLLQKLCTNLLTLDSRTAEWTFTHASVVEYLEQKHQFSSMHAHAYLGSACLLLTIDLSKSVSAKRSVGAVGCLLLDPQLDDDSWLAPEPDRTRGFPHDKSREDHREWPAGGNRNPLVKYAMRRWPGHVMRVVQELEDSTGKEIDHRQRNTADGHTSNKTDGLKLLVEKFFDNSTEGNVAYRFWCDWAPISRQRLKYLEHYGFIATSRRQKLGTRMPFLVDSIKRKDMVSTVVALGLFDFLSGRMWLEKLKVPPNSHLKVDIPIDWSSRSNCLHVTSFFGPASLVSALLDAGMDINKRSSKGELPLTLAIQGDCLETLALLFNRGGCDLNSLNGYDNPLYEAVWQDNTDMVRYLISKGANPNQSRQVFGPVEWEGYYNVLAYAVMNKKGAVLRFLIEEGNMDPNIPVSPRMGSAAILAAYHLNLDALKYLILSRRVEPNARVPAGEFETIMDAAVCKIHDWREDLIPCLEECGVDFSIQTIGDLDTLHSRIERDRSLGRVRSGKERVRCGSLLESVSAHGTLSAVQFVVEEWGQDVNALSDEGDYGSPLIAAVFNTIYRGVLRYLLSRGAEVNCQVPAGNYHNALLAALSLWENGDFGDSELEVVGVLVEHGANVNRPLEYGNFETAFAFITYKCLSLSSSSAVRTETHMDEIEKGFKLLIDNGADVNSLPKQEIFGSALVAAAVSGSEKGLKLLLDAGADPNLPLGCGHYGSALVAAAVSGSVRSLRLLLDAGADPDLPLKCGDYGSPLICVASKGYTVHVLFLLNRGAGINYTSTQGEFATALMAAASGGHEETFQRLVNKGADLDLPENREAELLLTLRCQQMQEYY